jgi:molecular chaperone GrpE
VIEPENLATEVAALRDLFQRRLMEDRDKRRLYDQLLDLVELARSDLERQMVTPIARELVMILDGIDSARHAGIDASQLVASIYDEIVEVLARRTIEPYDSQSQPFDPKWHDAVGQVPVQPDAVGLVMEERRGGWRFGTGLLRPARVVVGAAEVLGEGAG